MFVVAKKSCIRLPLHRISPLFSSSDGMNTAVKGISCHHLAHFSHPFTFPPNALFQAVTHNLVLNSHTLLNILNSMSCLRLHCHCITCSCDFNFCYSTTISTYSYDNELRFQEQIFGIKYNTLTSVG